MDAKTKADCLEAKDTMGGGCAWCSTAWQPKASCISETTGKYMPFAKCKFPKPAPSPKPSPSPEPSPAPAAAVIDVLVAEESKLGLAKRAANPCKHGNNPIPGAGCMSAKTEKECMKTKDYMGGCAWCKSQWQGQTCVSESQAKLDPMAQCKFAPEFTVGTQPKGVVVAKDAGSSAKAGRNPIPGAGCMSATTKKECMKTTDYMGGCAWCKSQWQGEICVSESQAKLDPMADCKFPPAKTQPKVVVVAKDAVTSAKAGKNPIPGAGCMSATTKKECMKTTDYMGKCAWCKSQWQGETCVSESQAKLDPMADCKFAPEIYGRIQAA